MTATYTFTKGAESATHVIAKHGSRIAVARVLTEPYGYTTDTTIDDSNGAETVENLLAVGMKEHIPGLMLAAYLAGEGVHFVSLG